MVHAPSTAACRTSWPAITARTLVLALALTLVLALAVATSGARPALAAQDASQVESQESGKELSQAEQRSRDLAAAQTYLDRLKTLKSKFIQIGPEGGFAEGTFYLSRPDRLRVEYAPPVEQLIVADGWQLIHVDKELDQVSYIPLSQTPAAIITRENLRFDDPDLLIDGYQREANAFAVTIRMRETPDQGAMTLVFTDKPVQLRQWIITDARNLKTRVTLTDPRINLPLSKELFRFKRDLKPGGGDISR